VAGRNYREAPATPLTKRQKLEKELSDAVSNEDYEKAAQMRDALRISNQRNNHDLTGTDGAGNQGGNAREKMPTVCQRCDVEIGDGLCANRAQDGEPVGCGGCAIVQKEVKKRRDSVEQFEKGGRQELADKEKKRDYSFRDIPAAGDVRGGIGETGPRDH